MKKKSQSLKAGILFIAVVMAIFTFAMFESGDNGNMERFNTVFNS